MAMIASPSGFMCTPSPVSQFPFSLAGFFARAFDEHLVQVHEHAFLVGRDLPLGIDIHLEPLIAFGIHVFGDHRGASRITLIPAAWAISTIFDTLAV